MSEVPSINSNVYPDVPMVTRRRDSVINYGQLSDVRKQNMASRVARVFLLSPSQDRVLLQLRNDSSGNPSAWDCSAEGWVYSTDVSATGECGDYKMAALRETNEELGLVYDSEQMTEIGHYLLDIAGINPAEWTKLYAATYDMGQQDRVKLSDEVIRRKAGKTGK